MTKLQILISTAAFLGFIHTLLGPDHYVPFIALSKARKWSMRQTLWITFFSGVGHILGSVVLGIFGVALGISLARIESIESMRGEITAWMFMVFGIFYFLYGIRKSFHEHNHTHQHFIDKIWKKKHRLSAENLEESSEKGITPWILFLIFVFGPCEVLIPMLIYPAVEHNYWGIASVSTIFGIATISTMLLVVYFSLKGSKIIKIKNGEKHFHWIAGIIILSLGLGIKFLGW